MHSSTFETQSLSEELTKAIENWVKHYSYPSKSLTLEEIKRRVIDTIYQSLWGVPEIDIRDLLNCPKEASTRNFLTVKELSSLYYAEIAVVASIEDGLDPIQAARTAKIERSVLSYPR